MNNEIEARCLAYLVYHWCRLPEIYQPTGIWIALHEAISKNAERIETKIEKTWFLNEDGMRQCKPHEYKRYSDILPKSYINPLVDSLGKNINDNLSEKTFLGTYKIGWASFATLLSSNNVCIEYSWGILFGGGNIYSLTTIDNHSKFGLKFERLLWRS